MRKETTPMEITTQIRNYCMEISDSAPVYVIVSPAPGMTPQNCFQNVSSLVEQVGGKQVNGWAIWQFANVYIYLEAHSVWQNDVGTLIDPTPHTDGEERILFLPDNKIVYEGRKIPGKRMPLTDSPLAKEYVALLTEMEDYIIHGFNGKKISPEDPSYPRLSYAYKRSKELCAIFRANVNRNDPCPCCSGLKYKKCCGRYD